MSAIAIGESHEITTVTERRHSAEEHGNPGVDVVATPALIGLLETVCQHCLARHLPDGHGSVGTRVDVEHLAAAPVGVEVTARCKVAAAKGARVSFAVEAFWGDRLLMRGTHERAAVELTRFLGNLPRP